MKKERIIIIRELLIDQMIHWFVFLLVLTILGVIGGSEPVLWKWILFSPVPFILFLIRRYTNQFVLFVGSHLLFLAALWFLPFDNIMEKFSFLICFVGYMIYSIYLRLKTTERLSGVPNPIAVVIGAGVARAFQTYQGVPEWERYYTIPIVVFLFLYFIQLYLEQYQYFVIVNDSSSSKIPEKAIFRSGLSLVSMFCVGASALFFLTSDIGWVGSIAKVLKTILRLILQFLLRREDLLADDKITNEEAWQGDTAQGGAKALDGETALIWVILEKVVTFVVCAALIIVIIRSIYSLIKFLYEQFHSRVKIQKKEIEDVDTDLREKCELDRNHKEKRSFYSLLGAKERIRRIYKKEVWAGRWQLAKDGNPFVLNRMTAKECGAGISRNKLAEVYEKARYSEVECTNEDIRRAKEK